jgi:hypothetical protein
VAHRGTQRLRAITHRGNQTQMSQVPQYPLPWATFGKVFLAALCARGIRRPRSFRHDAQACVAKLRPPLRVYGREHVPRSGPCLLTLNHYTRPGFQAWWLALAVSAVVQADVHWVMTSAWTYPDRLRSRTITPLTRWLFRRMAGVYGFTSMPPMPPDPRDTHARTVSVRQVLAYARAHPRPMIALAPEGGDAADGTLQWPPPGSGRFLLHLARLGLDIVPLGGFEEAETFCLRFGPPYRLQVPAHLPAGDRDREARRIAMAHIAAQLPAPLRGGFAGEREVRAAC